uniref:Uncharacterized protein n=1 Tax=Chrysotila carterae TaxID=13221 RepID=A0A7S4F4W3_CHRCT
MSPAQYHTTTPLRTLSRLAAIAATSWADAAASARAHVHELRMLQLAVFFTIKPGWSLRSAADVPCAFLRVIETHAFAVVSAFAIASTFALFEATAFSTCTLTVSAPAVIRLSCLLPTPAASLFTIIAAVVASTIVAYVASLLSTKGITAAAIVPAAATNARLKQLASSARHRSGLGRRASSHAKTSVLRAITPAALEEPRLPLIWSASIAPTHYFAVAPRTADNMSHGAARAPSSLDSAASLCLPPTTTAACATQAHTEPPYCKRASAATVLLAMAHVAAIIGSSETLAVSNFAALILADARLSCWPLS